MGWDETHSITTRLSSDIAAAYGEIFWDGMRPYSITTRLSSDIAAAYGEAFWDGMGPFPLQQGLRYGAALATQHTERLPETIFHYNTKAAAEPLLTEKHSGMG